MDQIRSYSNNHLQQLSAKEESTYLYICKTLEDTLLQTPSDYGFGYKSIKQFLQKMLDHLLFLIKSHQLHHLLSEYLSVNVNNVEPEPAQLGEGLEL